MLQESRYREGYREAGWLFLSALTAPMVLGCFCVYLYRLSADGSAIAMGIVLLSAGLLACSAMVLFAGDPTISMVSSSVALLDSVALFTILLPGSGSVFADAAILFAVLVAAVLLYGRTVDLPSIGRTRLKESSVLIVLLLPVFLAVGEALFLGLRFWESYQLGRPSLLFVPLLALWGYVEEGLFRGIVQRSAVPLMGSRGAIVLAAFLNSAFMLFWGSLPYAIFTFFLGLLMGYLYLRSRSLMYVGTVHALQDTWLIIAYLAMGIAIH